ncbi:HalOD1 output domain-containing protein [Natronococcus jeotgali]|uniref:HalOD1 output domain-containing protein n=1 Tax=Natronococcus jeotgali TaxID=413812 RepID=UPI000A03D418|nr:HalOD1 output domain-containing protein [Natronococcus jeotgali]
MPNSPVQQTSGAPSSEQRPYHETTPVVAVVSAVADAAGTDPLELPPLGNAINPEALNDLVGAERSPGLESISFEYAGYDVVVSGAGDIEVVQPE